jgi:exopolysaccharide biosynthesis predicted pyruvyltransferase EpsI
MGFTESNKFTKTICLLDFPNTCIGNCIIYNTDLAYYDSQELQRYHNAHTLTNFKSNLNSKHKSSKVLLLCAPYQRLG